MYYFFAINNFFIFFTLGERLTNFAFLKNKSMLPFLSTVLKAEFVTFKSDILKRNIRLNVSNAALRTVDFKGGLDFYLKAVKAYKLSSKAKKLKNKIIAKA